MTALPDVVGPQARQRRRHRTAAYRATGVVTAVGTHQVRGAGSTIRTRTRGGGDRPAQEAGRLSPQIALVDIAAPHHLLGTGPRAGGTVTVRLQQRVAGADRTADVEVRITRSDVHRLTCHMTTPSRVSNYLPESVTPVLR